MGFQARNQIVLAALVPFYRVIPDSRPAVQPLLNDHKPTLEFSPQHARPPVISRETILGDRVVSPGIGVTVTQYCSHPCLSPGGRYQRPSYQTQRRLTQQGQCSTRIHPCQDWSRPNSETTLAAACENTLVEGRLLRMWWHHRLCEISSSPQNEGDRTAVAGRGTLCYNGWPFGPCLVWVPPLDHSLK